MTHDSVHTPIAFVASVCHMVMSGGTSIYSSTRERERGGGGGGESDRRTDRQTDKVKGREAVREKE